MRKHTTVQELSTHRTGTSPSIPPSCAIRASLLDQSLFDIRAEKEFRCWGSFHGEWRAYSLSGFLARAFQLKKQEERSKLIIEEKQRDPFVPVHEINEAVDEEIRNSSRVDPKQDTANGLAQQVIEWLNEGIGPADKEANFEARKGVAEDFQALSPLLSSTLIYADVVYAHADWPLICFEIHAGASYENTLYKLIGVCTDHLRLLRNINNTIMETRGFVLPKNGEQSAVTELRVTWTDFQFNLKFRTLSIEAARNEIRQRKLSVHTLYRTKLRGYQRPNFFTLLPLSEQELKQFGSQAEQIRSNSAIVVHDPEEKLFYKYSFPGRVDLDLLFETRASNAIVTPSKRQKFGGLGFHVFPEINRSLSNLTSVRKHCVEYVKLLYDALESIHKQDRIAHLDVRIENTCFFIEEGQYKLRLIDFDRSHKVTAGAQILTKKYESNMYRGEDDLWDCGQLDFKQLGLLLASILDASYNVEMACPRGRLSLSKCIPS